MSSMSPISGALNRVDYKKRWSEWVWLVYVNVHERKDISEGNAGISKKLIEKLHSLLILSL